MAKEFKITINFTTKENISVVDLQRYFRNLLHHNGDLKRWDLKTEVKKD